jgi:hypothetical protein
MSVGNGGPTEDTISWGLRPERTFKSMVVGLGVWLMPVIPATCPSKKSVRLHLKEQSRYSAHVRPPSFVGGVGRRIVVRPRPTAKA